MISETNASIHRDEYARIHIDLYLYLSFTSKMAPFDLLISGGN